MANIVIKKNFVDGDKLFAQQLNNNFETIEKGINDGNQIIWQDGTEVKFKRLITEDIEKLPVQDGVLIYDIKKGAHYADYKGVRTVIGGDAKQIKISPTEPTTGEEVWIQKGKNFLDLSQFKSQTINGVAFTNNKDGSITINGTAETSFGVNFTIIPLKKGTYHLSLNANTPNDFYIYNYDTNENILNKEQTSTLLQDYNNLGLDTWIKQGMTFDNITIRPQLEQGSTTTSYEAYIDKKIYTKNDNGVYEEFVNVASLNALIPQRKYIVINQEYVYDSDLQYTCFKIGNVVFLNIGSIAFKKALSHENVLASKLPIPKEYCIGYLFGGQNAQGAEGSLRVAVNTDGDMVVHYGNTEIVGESSNKQFNGTIMYETID
jgi:hypothetical protein